MQKEARKAKGADHIGPCRPWGGVWISCEECWGHIEGFMQNNMSWFLFFFFNKVIQFLFIYLWLCWVFVSVRGLSVAAASGGHSSSRCVGLSLSRPLLLRSTGSRRTGSAVVAHGPSRSVACGIFPDQGLNPRPLHWQADSQPLRHRGSPWFLFLTKLPVYEEWTSVPS